MKKRNKALASVVAGTMLASIAGLAAAATINSDGPLYQIHISEDLNCDVRYVGDSMPEFYGGTACGTFAAAEGALFGPASVPAGGGAGPRTAWTPVSQVQGGAGTTASPYQITTVVQGDQLSLTQVDTYVSGQNSYKTTVSVTNISAEAVESVLYHAADCYLQDSDYGYGEYNSATGAVTCRAPDSEGMHSVAGRIEEFVPLSAGSDFIYGFYGAVWDAVGSQLPFPNEVQQGDTLIDNAMGLSWTLNLPAGETRTVSMLTNFSPLGEVALPTTLDVGDSSIDVAQETAVTATISNPNVQLQTIAGITITLPDAVEYVPDSATGVGAPEVSEDGLTLTFTGRPEIASSGEFTFTFKVRGTEVGGGSLRLEATTDGGAPVLGSSSTIAVEAGGEVGPVEVQLTAPQVTQASCSPEGEEIPPTVVLAGNTRYVTYTLEGDVAAGNTVVVKAVPAEGAVLPESAEGWEIDSEGAVATMQVVLTSVECEVPSVVVKAVPVDPEITQATCAIGPKVVMPYTEGTTYSGLPANLKAGMTFTLTATPSEGYELDAADGWVLQADGSATKAFTLAAAPTDCSTGEGSTGGESAGEKLPTTGANPWTAPLGFAGIALVAAGAAALAVRRKVQL